MKTERASSSGRYAYGGLDRVIHERARLSVLTSLIANPRGLTFNNLKQLCSLSDGNLSRHFPWPALAKSAFLDFGAGRYHS